MNRVEIKEVTDSILGDDRDIVCNIPLKDLIWTMVVYSVEMSNLEDEIFNSQQGNSVELDSLINKREYRACRRDELARLISQYTSFDTQRVWSEVDKFFKEWGFGE